MREQQQTAQQEAQVATIRQQMDKDFGDALVGENLPKTTETVRRMAQVMRAYNERGVTLEPKQAAKMVRQDIMGESVGTLGALDGDKIIAMLGPETMKKIRAADVARVRAAQKNGKVVQPVHAEPVMSKEKRPNRHLLSESEWRAKYGAE